MVGNNQIMEVEICGLSNQKYRDQVGCPALRSTADLVLLIRASGYGPNHSTCKTKPFKYFPSG
jgi:hypothetical protein